MRALFSHLENQPTHPIRIGKCWRWSKMGEVEFVICVGHPVGLKFSTKIWDQFVVSGDQSTDVYVHCGPAVIVCVFVLKAYWSLWIVIIQIMSSTSYVLSTTTANAYGWLHHMNHLDHRCIATCGWHLFDTWPSLVWTLRLLTFVCVLYASICMGRKLQLLYRHLFLELLNTKQI